MAELDDLMGPEGTEETGAETEAVTEEKSSLLQKINIPPNVIKIAIRVGIGLAALGIQAGLSFFLVTKVLSPFPEDPAEIMSMVESQTEQDSLSAVVVTDGTGSEATSEDNKTESTETASNDVSTYYPTGSAQPAPMIDTENIGSVFTLSDVVVNPALSGGKRFFIVTAVMLFEEKKMEEVALAREPILRDGYIRIMSRKTVRWFSSYSNQDILKKELIDYTTQVLDCSDNMYLAFTKYVLQ